MKNSKKDTPLPIGMRLAVTGCKTQKEPAVADKRNAGQIYTNT